MRAVLVALTEIKVDGLATGTGRRRPRPGRSRQLRSFSPIFPVRDLDIALAHYESLGFKTFAYEEGSDYGFADRDGVGLAFRHERDGGTDSSFRGLPVVRDADTLYDE